MLGAFRLDQWFKNCDKLPWTGYNNLTEEGMFRVDICSFVFKYAKEWRDRAPGFEGFERIYPYQGTEIIGEYNRRVMTNPLVKMLTLPSKTETIGWRHHAWYHRFDVWLIEKLKGKQEVVDLIVSSVIDQGVRLEHLHHYLTDAKLCQLGVSTWGSRHKIIDGLEAFIAKPE